MSDGDRATYYLLEYAVHFHIPVGQLSRPDFDEYLNRPHHGLGRGELLDSLLGLVNSGLIFLEENEIRISTPTRSLLDTGLTPREYPEGLYYGLTEKGGEHWATWSHADWSKFVSAEPDLLEESTEIRGIKGSLWSTTLTSQSRERAEAYLQSMPEVRQLVERQSIAWEELSPCSLTYWKTVPQGHKVTCRYLEVEGIPPVTAIRTHDQRQELIDIIGSSGWYTRPFTDE